MKLWHRDLSVGSPINGFLRFVRWEDAGAGNNGSGGDAGANGGGSGAGQGDGGAGDAGKGDAGQAGQAVDWKSTIDVSIKDHPALKDFKTPGDLAKSWVEVQKLVGVEKLPIPPANASPEAREQFLNLAFDRLGRPKDAKGYKLTEFKAPEGIDLKVSPEGQEALKVQAHKLGLLPHQLDGLYQWYMNDTASKLKAHNEALSKAKQDSEASLRTEFGAAYDAKVAKAQELLNKFGGEDYKSLLDSGFGNHPAVVRFMAKMADTISEDTFEKGGSESTMTPAEAQKELTAVRKQLIDMPQGANPEYKALLKRRDSLMEMAYPEGKGQA